MRRSGYEFEKIELSDSEYPEESAYWYAMDCERTVLAVTRSVNTTLALIDGLPDLLQDRRVEVIFTVMPRQRDANFERWMRKLVMEAGVREIGWDEAVSRRFDLVVTASYEGALDELSGHVVSLNHGTGVGKYLALPPDGRLPVRDDGESTMTLVLSHSEQRRYFADEQDPRAHFLIAGDPWRDRLCASKHRAGLYRAALGVDETTRLIVLSSTWGEYSLIATHPDLPIRLLNDLPWDEYRVALILHPNVWFGHSTWQVRAWMREALAAGLLLIPPHDSWRGALVAADAFVGDHGSMMLHAGALGLPMAFGCTPNDELIEDGPSAEIEARVPRLDPYSPLAPQIDRVFAEHDPDRDQETIDRVFEHPGESHAILRRRMYELMELDEPDGPPRPLAVDLPEVISEQVTAHQVVAEVEADGSVSVSRFPVVHASTPPPPPRNSHLVVEGEDRDLRLLQSATIVLRRGSDPKGDWRRSALREHPGARLVASTADPGSAVVTWRDGETVSIAPASGEPPFDAAVAVSALHAQRIAGRPGDPLPDQLKIKVGARAGVFRLDRHRVDG